MYSSPGTARRAAIRNAIHPLHALLLSFVFPLFLGTLVSDIAYLQSAQIQWANFAQWLNAAGLFVGGFALLAALISLIRRRPSGGGKLWAYALILLIAWVTGLMNAFIHTRDAWGIFPDALWWSSAAALLALIASWLAYSGFTLAEDY